MDVSKSIPGLATVTASEYAPPPDWALAQRQLVGFIEKSADLAEAKYARPDGMTYNVMDVDDAYESRSMRALFYAIGADDRLLRYAEQSWNGITHYYGDGSIGRDDDPPVNRSRGYVGNTTFEPQLHNEYYNLVDPYDWMHQGEGNIAFYDICLADPTNPDFRRRATRFAAMFTGDDPEAPNYDRVHKIIRSPFPSSVGPLLQSDNVKFVQIMLDPIDNRSGRPTGYSQRSNLYPIIKDLDDNWHENPKRRAEVMDLFADIVLNGDVADNLGATAVVTNAYLYTGDEKYRRWVLDYTDAWLDRLRQNGGIMPDNVGSTGKIGEKRNGQWWGGMGGWNSKYSADIQFISSTIAAECALMLTGDVGYMELIRSQIEVLLDNAVTDDHRQLLVPTRYGPEGWFERKPMRIRELAHIYHASYADDDYDLLTRIRDGDVDRDWNDVQPEGDRRSGNSEYARFQYYDGKNPGWPQKILGADYMQALAHYEFMRRDTRDASQIAADNRWPPNPVIVKGLTQVTMGCPQTLYNGGLLRATVRYFDQDRARPGLPQDVAALVDGLGPDFAGIHLVNTSTTEARNLIVQAGAFGEHHFTELRYREFDSKGIGGNPSTWLRGDKGVAEKTTAVDSQYFSVRLPAMASVRLQAGMRRFAHQPSYAYPWHGGTLPTY